MKPLATDFVKLDFSFHQIDRRGMVALFRRRGARCTVDHFEVVRVGSHNGYEIAGVKIPPSELYPGPTDWGKYGFTFNDRDSADRKFLELSAPAKASVNLDDY